jgi:hypothetical protein
MSGSNVQGNIARNGSGGGLAVFDNVRCELSNNTRVRHNEVTTFGGGLFAANNTLVSVVYADVEHNKAGDSGGGIGAFGASSVDLMNASNVNDNTAGSFGGGVFVRDNARLLLIGKSRVRNNVACNGSGGGLVVWDNADVRVIVDSSVEGNSAKEAGGGLQVCGQASVTINDSSVARNTVVNGSGGGLSVLAVHMLECFLASSTTTRVLADRGVALLLTSVMPCLCHTRMGMPWTPLAVVCDH